jgi:hypothetical protein
MEDIVCQLEALRVSREHLFPAVIIKSTSKAQQYGIILFGIGSKSPCAKNTRNVTSWISYATDTYKTGKSILSISYETLVDGSGAWCS